MPTCHELISRLEATLLRDLLLNRKLQSLRPRGAGSNLLTRGLPSLLLHPTRSLATLEAGPTTLNLRVEVPDLLQVEAGAAPRVSPRGAPFLPPPIPLPETPVGARLLLFSEVWAKITQDAWVLHTVREGLTFDFKRRPPLSRVPIELVSGHPGIPEAIAGLLEKQAVERVTEPNSPGFYSRLFLVQKKNGSWRPVIDLKVLNNFLDVPIFKMETPNFIRDFPYLFPHLHWWMNEERLLEGVILLTSTPYLQFISDASLVGWGAHLEPLRLTVSGLWSPLESQLHINNLDMRAVT